MTTREILNLIREEIATAKRNELLVEFNCPCCAHKTVARKESHIEPSCPSSFFYVRQENWNDRRCLVCGKLFKQSVKTSYEEAK